MNAPVMYIARFWIAPAGRDQLFAWLDGEHTAEVVSQPGFLFFRRVKLEQKSEDGWDSYMMVYGLESQQALDNYFADKALHDKFARQRAPFIQHLRMERAWGKVDAAIDR